MSVRPEAFDLQRAGAAFIEGNAVVFAIDINLLNLSSHERVYGGDRLGERARQDLVVMDWRKGDVIEASAGPSPSHSSAVCRVTQPGSPSPSNAFSIGVRAADLRHAAMTAYPAREQE